MTCSEIVENPFLYIKRLSEGKSLNCQKTPRGWKHMTCSEIVENPLLYIKRLSEGKSLNCQKTP